MNFMNFQLSSWSGTPDGIVSANPRNLLSVLDDVIPHLACPVCHGGFLRSDGTLRCDNRHSFDIARQGYVNLTTGGSHSENADSAAMVEARTAFLGKGFYAPLADLLAQCAGVVDPELIVDAGAGTGYYLANALDLSPANGIALDLSKHALRRAARAHERIGAVVTDVWQRLPLHDNVADVLLDVFAPRNASEFARVLRPGGLLLVATPTAKHLAELVDVLGLLTVDEHKDERLSAVLQKDFSTLDSELCESLLSLDHQDVELLVAMGPSAHHVEPTALAAKLRALPKSIRATLSVRVSAWRRR